MGIWLCWAGDLIRLGIMYCLVFSWVGDLVGLGIWLDCICLKLWLGWRFSWVWKNGQVRDLPGLWIWLDRVGHLVGLEIQLGRRFD